MTNVECQVFKVESVKLETTNGYDWLILKGLGQSVDEAIKVFMELPEFKAFLDCSTLGWEYISAEFNHGNQITVKMPRYSSSYKTCVKNSN